jgi:hypothetical protein
VARPITFTGIKLQALDAARRDPEISDLDYRVLSTIAEALDRTTEQAIRKRETLARDAGGKSVRAIEKSVARLEKRGLIVIHRGRGRGFANVYELAPQRANNSTPFTAAADPQRANSGTPFAVLKKAHAEALKGERRGQEKANSGSPPPLSTSRYSSLPQSATAGHSGEHVPRQQGVGDQRKIGEFWCEPHSTEFTQWLAYYTDNRMTRAKQGMISAMHLGRSVRVPSQWPPDKSGLAAIERLRAKLRSSGE